MLHFQIIRKKNYVFGTLLGILSMICFSFYAVFGKILLVHIPPHVLLGLGQIVTILCILLLFGILPEIKKIRHLTLRQILLLILNACIVGGLSPLLLLTGLQQASATNTILLASTESLFLGFFGVLFLKEKITSAQIFGMVCMFIGIALIASGGFQNSLVRLEPGTLLILSAVFIGSIGSLIFKKFLHMIAPELIMFFRNTIGAMILLGIIPLFIDTPYNINVLIEKDMFHVLIIYALIVILSAQLLWYKSLKILPAFQISLILLLLPLFGVLFSVAILQEKLALYHLWGGLGIFIGMIISNLHFEMDSIHQKSHHVKQFHH